MSKVDKSDKLNIFYHKEQSRARPRYPLHSYLGRDIRFFFLGNRIKFRFVGRHFVFWSYKALPNAKGMLLL